MCPCHPQAAVMVAMIFFAEMPEWQWHYDHAMDSLYLTVTSRVCLYVTSLFLFKLISSVTLTN